MTPKLRFPEFTDVFRSELMSDVVELRHGYQFRSNDFTNGGIAVIKIKNVIGTNLNLSELSYISSDRMEEFKRFRIEKGDILMSLTGNIGRVIEVEETPFPILQNYRVGKFVPNEEISSSYLKYLLASDSVLGRFTKLSNQSAQANFGKQDMDKIVVHFPSIEEQRKIGCFLNCLDNKINLLTKKKEALETYKKGLMQKIFSQQLRFKGKDGTDYPEWERVTLNDIVRSNIRYGIVQPGDFTVDGMILIRGVDYMKGWNDIGNFFRVSESIESKYRKARVKNGDLLISIVGTPGKAVIVPDYIKEANITQTTARVPLSDDQSEIFYKEQINDYRIQKDISKLIKGAAQPGINVEDVKKLKVFQPSYEEQKRLEKMFNTLIQRIISIEKQMNLSKEIKKGLLQQMFV